MYTQNPLISTSSLTIGAASFAIGGTNAAAADEAGAAAANQVVGDHYAGPDGESNGEATEHIAMTPRTAQGGYRGPTSSLATTALRHDTVLGPYSMYCETVQLSPPDFSAWDTLWRQNPRTRARVEQELPGAAGPDVFRKIELYRHIHGEAPDVLDLSDTSLTIVEENEWSSDDGDVLEPDVDTVGYRLIGEMLDSNDHAIKRIACMIIGKLMAAGLMDGNGSVTQIRSSMLVNAISEINDETAADGKKRTKPE